MTKVKVNPNFRRIASLLGKIGRWNLIVNTWLQIRSNKFEQEERDRLICLLVKFPEISIKEIAECFGLSGRGVYWVADRYGVDLEGLRSIKSRSLRRLEFLGTGAGRREAVKVMRHVARDKRFWTRSDGRRGPIRRQLVLSALGFPEIRGESFRSEVWAELFNRGIVQEYLLPGVILRYGLGVDPQEFFRRHYISKYEATLEDVMRLINRKAWWARVVRIGKYETLRLYAHELGIPVKTRGSRGPHPWTRRRS